MLIAGGAMAGGLLLAAKNAANLEERLVRLGIASSTSNLDIQALYKSIKNTAINTGTASDEIMTSIEGIIQRTGDMKFAKQNIENIAIAMQATGSTGEAIGGLVSNLKKLGITSKGDVKLALDIFATQGKAGAFELKNFADMGERLLAPMAALGYEGLKSARGIGAFAQYARMASGSSEQATTSVEAFFRAFSDVSTLKKLNSIGINAFNMINGTKQLKELPVLINEIMKKTKGDAVSLSSIFADSEARKSISMIAAEYKKMGNLDNFNKLVNAFANGSTLMGDFGKASGTTNARLTKLTESFQEIVITLGTGLLPFINPVVDFVRSLTDKFSKLSPFMKKMIVNITLITTGLLLLGGIIGTVIIPTITGLTALFASGGILAAGSTIVGALGTAFSFVSGILATIAGVLGMTISPLLAGLGVIATTILVPAFTALSGFIVGFGKGFAEALAPAMPVIKKLLNDVKPLIDDLVAKVNGFVNGALNNLKTSLGWILGTLKEIFIQSMKAGENIGKIVGQQVSNNIINVAGGNSGGVATKPTSSPKDQNFNFSHKLNVNVNGKPQKPLVINHRNTGQNMAYSH